MDRATYNTIRLKAYYWEKQILRGREDELAKSRFLQYSEQLENAKKELEAARALKRQEAAAAAARKAEEWRKNVRRRPAKEKGYDSWTLKMMEKAQKEWNPSLEISFQ